MIPINENLLKLKRSGIRLYTNLARTVDDCVMLTIGEPDFDTPQAIKDAAAAAIAANQTHYAPNQGTDALRKAIAAYENRRGLRCNENEVLVTVGACEALYTALFGILNPGEEVIVPTPAFPLYETIATTAGAKVVELDLKKTNFQITKEALEAVITPKTKAIVLNSPNNPSGAVFDDESLAAVKAAVLGKPIYVICDNVYQQLSMEKLPDLSLDEELKDQILLCQSFSKPYAMTGWRVGYLIGSEEVISRLLLLHAGMVTAIPTFLQTACITALETDTTPMAEVYAKRRDYVCSRLKDMGLTFPEPKGAFYVFPDITKFGMDSGEFCTRLIKEAKVATVPGSCFGAEGHIRISYCCSDENLQKGMDRLEQFLLKL
jgi:aminotransferase